MNRKEIYIEENFIDWIFTKKLRTAYPVKGNIVDYLTKQIGIFLQINYNLKETAESFIYPILKYGHQSITEDVQKMRLSLIRLDQRLKEEFLKKGNTAFRIWRLNSNNLLDLSLPYFLRYLSLEKKIIDGISLHSFFFDYKSKIVNSKTTIDINTGFNANILYKIINSLNNNYDGNKTKINHNRLDHLEIGQNILLLNRHPELLLFIKENKIESDESWMKKVLSGFTGLSYHFELIHAPKYNNLNFLYNNLIRINISNNSNYLHIPFLEEYDAEGFRETVLEFEAMEYNNQVVLKQNLYKKKYYESGFNYALSIIIYTILTNYTEFINTIKHLKVKELIDSKRKEIDDQLYSDHLTSCDDIRISRHDDDEGEQYPGERDDISERNQDFFESEGYHPFE